MIKWLAILLLVFSNLPGWAQDNQFQRYEDAVSRQRGPSDFRLAFYNLENLFDLENDSVTADDSFTPEGSNSYTYSRYKKKSDGLAKTMSALGGWQPADIIGLCEVESMWVMKGLVEYSPLKKVNYQIIHEDSPDRRGIDIACVYNPKRFNLIAYKYFRVKFPFDPDRKTRDILYVKGILPNADTLHLFVNHWPSRYGGQFASEPSRAYVADMIRAKVDSLNEKFSNPNIVLCGDFNDEPDDLSLKDHLNAKLKAEEAAAGDLVNLMYPIKYRFGTHSYAGEWGVLDHFIVSESLLSGTKTLTAPEYVGVFDAPWLLTKNAAGTTVPLRTYQGPAYKGGFSDHLPIFLDLVLIQNQ